jgi:hypothetical protein
MRRNDNESEKDDDSRHKMYKKIPTSTSHWKVKPLVSRDESRRPRRRRSQIALWFEDAIRMLVKKR